MIKSFMTFLIVFAFLSQSKAIEFGFVKNTENPGVGGPLLFTIDGGWRFRATLFNKIMACYETFSSEDQKAFEKLFDHIDKLKLDQTALNENGRKFTFSTVTNAEEHEAFANGPLKACLSK